MNLTCAPVSQRSLLRLCAAVSIGLCTVVGTAAQAAYPDKPMKLVVPYPPGGATDVIGRIIASRLSESLGQQVIVENRSGAGGNIGAEAVARAPADGYTLLMGALTSHATIATLEKGKLRYSITKDFVPVMVVGAVPLVVVVTPGLPVKDLKELVAYGKANPNKLTYASSGPGAPQRMAAEILRKEAGIRMIHVPYKGSGPAMVDLVGGQVNLMAETVPAALQFIKAGQLRALAVTTKERISMLPDIPTTAEAGLPEVEVSSTFGVLAPAGTPKEIVERLNSAVAGIVGVPEVREQFLGQGVYAAAPTTSEQSAARLNQEVERWAKLITEANIQPD
jgi:tripartite-type tricarboxylate transporter receptor subunit TctC